jgi:catechol 2,3-dioxygenase-like lactoylglutathione lyase family enzyme
MISRRHLLAALAAIPALPVRVFDQDAAGGRGQQQRDTTPLVPPFEATGWKTVWLDHLNYQCVDYKKAAAFYATLMGWKVRSDDGKQAVLDIGENSGGIVIRGGMTAPPPAAITDTGLGVSRPKVQAVFDGFAWGHRAVGHRQGEGRARKTRPQAGCRSSRREDRSYAGRLRLRPGESGPRLLRSF